MGIGGAVGVKGRMVIGQGQDGVLTPLLVGAGGTERHLECEFCSSSGAGGSP